MKSIGNIQKITKTMEMVSVAKMKRAVSKTVESKTYANKARTILSLISGGDALAEHVLVRTPETIERELIVIIASDKGLCGGYHVQLARTIRDYKKDCGHELSAICIGKYSEKIANRFQIPIVASFVGLPETLDSSVLGPAKKLLLGEFESGVYQKVTVAYTEYVKSLVYTPRMQTLLPLSITDVIADHSVDKNQYSEYKFEPSNVQIFNAIAPGLLSSILFQFLLEAKAAEHSSRMVAMKNASDNASGLRDELVISYNRIRQAAITQEITEIISGANAIQ